MRTKSLIILAAILCLLIILTALQFYLPRFFKKPSFYQEKIKSIEPKSLVNIEITKKEKSLNLKKEENVWKINGKKGDTEKIEELIKNLITSANSELVAETNKRHKEFELTDELATKISFNEKLIFLAGKSLPDGVYVRFEKTDPVFLVKNLSSQNFSLDPQDWYDKTIAKIEEKNIQRLHFAKGKEKFTLMKEDNKWKLEDSKKEIEINKLNPILTTLSSFQTRTLPDKDQVSKYPLNPTVIITIEYNGGKEILTFFKGENDYLLKRESDGEYFTISEYQAKDFLTSPQDLVKKS